MEHKTRQNQGFLYWFYSSHGVWLRFRYSIQGHSILHKIDVHLVSGKGEKLLYIITHFPAVLAKGMSNFPALLIQDWSFFTLLILAIAILIYQVIPTSFRYRSVLSFGLLSSAVSTLRFRVTAEILDLRGFENLGGFGEASEISDPKIKL
jgi:hypothetical protein